MLVAKLMRQLGLRSKTRRRRRYNSYRAESSRRAATWPKVDATLAADSKVKDKAWYLKNDANGQATKDTYANAFGVASPTERLESGAEATAYLGTTQASIAASDFAKEAKDTNAPALKTLFTDTDKLKIATDAIVKTDALSGKKMAGYAKLAEVKKVFPDVDEKQSQKDWMVSLGVDVDKVYVTDPPAEADLKAALQVFNNAVDNQVKALEAAAAAAGKANTAAIKAKTDALFKLISGGAVNYNVNRLGGADRFATAVKIATHVYGEKGEKMAPTRIYFANGMAFADAAVAGYIDNSNYPGPVLLVNKDSVPSVTGEQALAWDKVVDYVPANVTRIGGTGVISDENGAAELEKLAPATAASGTVSFGPWALDTTNHTAEIAVTTKDMPNGSTLTIEWYGRTGDAGTGAVLKAGDSLGDKAVSSVTTTPDTNSKVKIALGGTPTDASSVRVKVTAKNSSGEVITETYSTWSEIKQSQTRIRPGY